MRYHLRQLELLYWVFSCEGMGPAAEKLKLTGSTLSQHIQELENSTGTLFNRRPFRELPEGRRIFDAIKGMFDWREAEHARHLRPGAGWLRVGAAPLVCSAYVAPLLPALRQLLGDTQLIVHGAAEAELRERLAHGQLDLIIAPDARAPVDGEAVLLLNAGLALLVSRQSRIRTGARWWAQMHPRERLICPGRDTAIGQAFESYLAREKLQIPVAIATDSTHPIAAMVLAGDGIGVVLDVAGNPPPKGLRRVPLRDAGEIPIRAAWRSPASPAVEQAMKIFRARATELAAERAEPEGIQTRGAGSRRRPR